MSHPVSRRASTLTEARATPTQEEREKRKLWQQLESVGRVINQIVGMADMFGQFGPSPAPARKYQGFDTKPSGPEEPKEQEKPTNWKEVKFDAAAAIVRGVVRAASPHYSNPSVFQPLVPPPPGTVLPLQARAFGTATAVMRGGSCAQEDLDRSAAQRWEAGAVEEEVRVSERSVSPLT